jgi:predicted metal-binding membrane protein
MNAALHRSVFLPVMGALVALSWLLLWVWEQSPYGRYLHHNELAGLGFDSDIGDLATQAGLYVGGWVLMMVAMMLPTTLPLIEVFRRVVARRADRILLVTLLIGGYLLAWLAFGVAAHMADYGLHEAAERSDWLGSNPWIFGAGPLLLAGGFQFTRLKYMCLDKCRSPRSFVMEHWRGRRERTQSLLLGVHHGIFCVGCCWALMLLMFAVGTGNLGWMLALAAVMAIEKNLPWGRELGRPLGAALIGWGFLIVLNNAWSWQ